MAAQRQQADAKLVKMVTDLHPLYSKALMLDNAVLYLVIKYQAEYKPREYVKNIFAQGKTPHPEMADILDNLYSILISERIGEQILEELFSMVEQGYRLSNISNIKGVYELKFVKDNKDK